MSERANILRTPKSGLRSEHGLCGGCLASLVLRPVQSSFVFLIALVQTGQVARGDQVPGTVVSAAQIIESMGSGKSVSLRSVSIVGPVDLSVLPIADGKRLMTEDISISDSRFEGPVIGAVKGATSVTFEKPVQLTRDVFLQDVGLGKITFQSPVTLSYNTFQKSLNLDHSVLTDLDLRGTTIGQRSQGVNVSFERLLFDKLTDLDKVGLTTDAWNKYLADVANQVRTYRYLYSQAADSIRSNLDKLPQDSNVQYLARVVGTNAEQNWFKSDLNLIFLDYKTGYGFKLSRLLFWVFPIGLVGLLLSQRRLNAERIARERGDGYPLWEERIDRNFVGEPSVNLSFIPKRHRDYAIVEYRSRRKDLDLVTSEDTIISANASQITALKTAWLQADMAIVAKSREAFANATARVSDMLCERLAACGKKWVF